MVGAHQNLKWFTRPDHAPFRGFVVRRLGLATINMPTKFEVFIFTHYEDMQRGTICEKWGVF